MTSINKFQKIYIKLDISGSNQYNMTNNQSYTDSCFLNFNLNTSNLDEYVMISIIQKSSVNGTIINSNVFNVDSSNNSLNRNINLFTPYTLIDISNNLFSGLLTGFIEKLTTGPILFVDVSGQTMNVQGTIDISGQLVDISNNKININEQRLDISGQRLDISGQTLNINSNSNKININEQILDISGQIIDISGERLDISDNKIDISGQRLDINGQSIVIQGNDGTNNRMIKTDITGNLYSIITDGTNYTPVTNNSDITGSNIYGINIYKPFSKVKSFPFNTYTLNTSGDVMIVRGSFTPYNIGLGLAKASTWYASTNFATTVNLRYTYIDSNGNEGTSSINVPTGSSGTWTPLTLAGGVSGTIVSINEYKPTNFDLSGSALIYISKGLGSVNNMICYNSRTQYFIGVFTCPNNAIAWISDINLNTVGTAGEFDHIRLWKYDTSGKGRTVKIWYKINNGSRTLYMPGSLTDSTGGYLKPGETFAWSGERNTTTSRIVYSTMTVMYF